MGGRLISYMSQAWLVLILALFFGTALAMVEISLGPRIAFNRLQEILEKVPDVVDASAPLQVKPLTLELNPGGKTRYYSAFEAAYSDKSPAGLAVKASGQGYGGSIELLIGMDLPNHLIKGIYILDQKETPGLGNRISEPLWLAQFKDHPMDQPYKLIKQGQKEVQGIDAVSGATISSKAVVAIMNQVMEDMVFEPVKTIDAAREDKK